MTGCPRQGWLSTSSKVICSRQGWLSTSSKAICSRQGKLVTNAKAEDCQVRWPLGTFLPTHFRNSANRKPTIDVDLQVIKSFYPHIHSWYLLHQINCLIDLYTGLKSASSNSTSSSTYLTADRGYQSYQNAR